LFRLAIKELTRRKKLYLLNVIVIGLVVAMIITLNSLAAAYKDASRLPFEDIQGTIVIQRNGNVPINTTGVLLSCSLAPINQQVIPQISAFNGVRNVSSALSLWVFDPDYFKRILGVNWGDNFGKKLSSEVIEGMVPRTNQEILIEKTYAQQHGLVVGKAIESSGQSFTVTGIIRTSGNEIVAADVYLNLAAAQQMAYQSENLQAVEAFEKTDVNIIFVDTAQTEIKPVTQLIKDMLNNDLAAAGQTPLGQTISSYNIYTPQSFENQISSIFKISDKLTWIISLVIFIGAALIIARNVLRSITERRKEFGIMKSVGFRSWDVQREIFVETTLQASIGFVIGLIISAVVIGILSRTTISISIPWELTAYPHFLLANPEDANVVQTHFLPIKFVPIYVLASFATVIVVGVLAAFLATWRVNGLKPMEVLKYE
jgi:ABC-type antimicrobial peptide transport system permease subunit